MGAPPNHPVMMNHDLVLKQPWQLGDDPWLKNTHLFEVECPAKILGDHLILLFQFFPCRTEPSQRSPIGWNTGWSIGLRFTIGAIVILNKLGRLTIAPLSQRTKHDLSIVFWYLWYLPRKVLWLILQYWMNHQSTHQFSSISKRKGAQKTLHIYHGNCYRSLLFGNKNQPVSPGWASVKQPISSTLLHLEGLGAPRCRNHMPLPVQPPERDPGSPRGAGQGSKNPRVQFPT